MLPPFDYNRRSPGALHFEGRGGKLYANNVEFQIKGVNWFGSENRAGPPLGLDRHNISWYVNWLADRKFNAIRLLFNHEMILANTPLEKPNRIRYGPDAKWEAPELEGYRYLDMFAHIAELAAERGLLVLMAAHRLEADAWPGEGLWYDGAITEAKVMESWEKIGAKMCGQWNVFGADLVNEPHAASWGKDDKDMSRDWGLAASRLGDNVLRSCARWLVFVEGVGYSPGAPGMDRADAGIWWGENLAGVKVKPISLVDPSKLVYSPHEYGPGVYHQKYFESPEFPNNLAAIWRARWEFVREQTGAPVVVGEMGGFYEANDKVWMDWALGHLVEEGIGLFYFALQPGSKDTGGLLKDDWTTPEKAKLAALDKLPSTDVLTIRRMTPPPFPSVPSFRVRVLTVTVLFSPASLLLKVLSVTVAVIVSSEIKPLRASVVPVAAVLPS